MTGDGAHNCLVRPALQTRMNAGFRVANNSVRNRRGFSMRKVGYARVSSSGQNLDRQLGALVAEGCGRIFQEKASGKSIKNRPELEKAMNALGTGDVLVLAEWDRCTRSMIDGVAIIEGINARGAGEGAGQAAPGPHNAAWEGLPGLPERHGGGRAAENRRASPFQPQGCPRARRTVRPQAALSADQQADAKGRLAGGESARSLGRI